MSLNVLIVENEVLVAWDLRSILEEAGHIVCASVSDISTVIDLAKHSHPDVVVLDASPLHGLSTIETAKTLRERYGIPVIFVTGTMQDSELFRQITGVEPLSIVSKPFTKEGILAAVGLVEHLNP